MNLPQTIASAGFIEKKEKLSSLKSPVNHTEFILESVRPYPGYYSPQNVPSWGGKDKTNSLYLGIKPFTCFNEACVTKISQRIQKSIQNIDACPGKINISGRDISCIRIRLNSPYLIPEIIEKYIEQGIYFLKKRKIEDVESMIKIQKFMKMNLIKDAIYQDINDPEMYYLQIPKELSWANFESITTRVKNSLKMYNFDAALCSIYQESGFVEFIRIYSPDISVSELENIKEIYLKTL